MRLSLCPLFAAIGGDTAYNAGDTGAAGAGGDQQGELFGGPAPGGDTPPPDDADSAIMAALHAPGGMDLAALPPAACRLFELSVDAFTAIVQAWMSELPLTPAIIRYGQKILAAADGAADAGADERQAAGTAATDRGDADAQAVLEAAYKVWHETHRLMGLLRFSPDEDGVYIARCEPDHLVLPALAPHFSERFGPTPWAIMDEKRRLCVSSSGAPPARARPRRHDGSAWETLWKHYHQTINNESRSNPAVQKRFMPTRYWKYLTELT